MNTVVIAVHQCPVSALGPYGNEWVATPHLDRLAAAGVVFDRHYADCPTAAAARAAWRTGMSQVPPRDGAAAPPAAGPDLLARLAAAGVKAVLVDATRPGHELPAEFYAGFAERFACPPRPGDPTPTTALLETVPAVAAAVRGSAWLVWVELDRLAPPWDVPQDVFDAYIEDVFDATPDDPASRESTLDADEVLTADDDIVVIDPTAAEYTEEVEDDAADADEPAASPGGPVVTPWADPPAGWFDRDDPEDWELLHRSFAAAVTVFDAGLGKLFAALTELGLGDAAWLLTADRGQPLGEHGLVGGHRPWLHEELVHVPLVVRLPAGAGAGRRVAGLTVPADVMPTLLALHGLPAPAGLDGVSLMPQLERLESTARTVAVSGLTTPEASEWAARTAAWAYLEPGRTPDGDPPRGPLLYVKPDDRYEVNDVAAAHLEVAEELAAVLAGTSPPGPLSEAERG